jgi:hypothetical protein
MVKIIMNKKDLLNIISDAFDDVKPHKKYCLKRNSKNDEHKKRENVMNANLKRQRKKAKRASRLYSNSEE